MKNIGEFYVEKEGKITVRNLPCFDPYLSADCGQAFRWSVDEEGVLGGVMGNRILKIRKTAEGEYDFFCDRKFFEEKVIPYFDLERDYAAILSSYDNETLCSAVKKYYGIRILKQDEWETLCSFIISQNNNIPRIKGIINRLCQTFGTQIEGDVYSFPPAEVLAAKEVEDLAPLRAGFRAKYIIDAARKVATGEVDLERIHSLSLEEGEAELTKIKGVGKKVAQCTLLFGFGRVDAFPIDVWIKRIMAEKYPDGLPECTIGTQGIAQQYMFMDARDA